MAYIGNAPTSVAFLVDQFSANGSGTVYTLSAAPANTASIIVAVSGVLQDPSTYSVTGTSLTFSAAPPAGTGNISVRFLGIPASGVTTTAYRTLTEFTATAGQTTFTPPSYTVGYINVYRNGVMLGTADFTATNGTTVVLATGATAGDLITTESFYVSSVLNAIPAVANAVTDTYLNTGAVTQTKLAAGVAGTGPAFSVYRSSSGDTSFTTGTWTKMILDAETFDTNNCFDSTTNYRFTPTVAGYYQINGSVFSNWSGGQFSSFFLSIYKNGSAYRTTQILINAAADIWYGNVTIGDTVYLNGSTDYIEFYVNATGGSGPTYNGPSTRTYASGSMVRAA